MAYRVFISYSTKDIGIVNYLISVLQKPGSVETFVAEYSVAPGDNLNPTIENNIRSCDLFVLLWSRNSAYSEYVPQEIGIARGSDRQIIPIVLDPSLSLPAFINHLKYLPAYEDIEESLCWLQHHVFSLAEKQQITNGIVLIGIGALIIYALKSNKCFA